jgi:putative transposase
MRHLIHDQDGKYPALSDTVPADSGITVVRSGVQVPRMNAIMERWVRTCRRELLDRALIWNQRHLLYALREFEVFYNEHRPHQGINNTDPSYPCPNRSPTRTSSPGYASAAATVSAAYFTNTNMPHDQHRRNSRQVQRRLVGNPGGTGCGYPIFSRLRSGSAAAQSRRRTLQCPLVP